MENRIFFRIANRHTRMAALELQNKIENNTNNETTDKLRSSKNRIDFA